MATSKTVTLLTLIPEGLPLPEHFELVEGPAPVESVLPEGALLLKALCFSADPYLRGGCKSGAVPRPMSGFVSGKVLASKKEGWVAGDFFGASLPFTTVQVLTAEAAAKTLLWKLTGLVDKATNISRGIGVLGMPGSTAYGGLIDVLRPKPAAERKPGAAPEVLWVSGAAGAVGGMVGQLAKQLYGCTVIGSCGGADKCALVTEKFGFDFAIDYKACGTDGAPATAKELAAAVRAVCPDGVDMYFDNVGGAHFEAAMAVLRPHGRVAVCGGIAHYNAGERQPERIFPTDMIYTFQRIEGFTCMPWLSGAKGQFLADMAQWLGEGKVAVEETSFAGAASWPMAFQALFTGANTGKVVVDVSAD
jgi:hypothetical protein